MNDGSSSQCREKEEDVCAEQSPEEGERVGEGGRVDGRKAASAAAAPRGKQRKSEETGTESEGVGGEGWNAGRWILDQPKEREEGRKVHRWTQQLEERVREREEGSISRYQGEKGNK